MNLHTKQFAACLFLACLTFAPAQQQTGAPAGIPVPRVPPSPSMRSSTAATQSLTYRVRVLDGRNGNAIHNAHVKLWYDEPSGPGYEFATDVQGYGSMPAPVSEPIRVLATVLDYNDCRRPLRGDPPVGYNLQSITTTGLAAQNGCGRVTVRTSPGELVLFARPSHWYEGINHSVGN